MKCPFISACNLVALYCVAVGRDWCIYAASGLGEVTRSREYWPGQAPWTEWEDGEGSGKGVKASTHYARKRGNQPW